MDEKQKVPPPDYQSIEDALLAMSEKEYWLWRQYPHERLFYFPHLIKLFPNMQPKDNPGGCF